MSALLSVRPLPPSESATAPTATKMADDHALEALRSTTGSLAVGLYVLAGAAWEQAHEAMRRQQALLMLRDGLLPAPPPRHVECGAASRPGNAEAVLGVVE